MPRHLNYKGPKLSPRERQVLSMLAEGYANAEIAERLSLSRRTAEAHRSRIMLKLNIHDLAGLVKYALREGLTTLESHGELSTGTD